MKSPLSRFLLLFSLLFFLLVSFALVQGKFNYLKFFTDIFRSFSENSSISLIKNSFYQKAEAQSRVGTIVYKAMIGTAKWEEMPIPSESLLNTRGGFDLAFTPKRELTDSEKENIKIEITKVPQMGRSEVIGTFKLGEEISLPLSDNPTGTSGYQYYAKLVGSVPGYQFLNRCEKINYTQTESGNFVPLVYRKENFNPLQLKEGQKVECILGFASPWGEIPQIIVKGGDVPTGEVIKEDSTVGSLEFMGNILDYTRVDNATSPSSGLAPAPYTNTIQTIRFLTIDGKKLLLVLRNDAHLLVYDISDNPFSPTLLKDNDLSSFMKFAVYGGRLLVLDNFDYIIWIKGVGAAEPEFRSLAFHIQKNGLVEFVGKYKSPLNGLFRGLDNKVYGYYDNFLSVSNDVGVLNVYNIDLPGDIKEVAKSERFVAAVCDREGKSTLGHYLGKRGVINQDGKLYLINPGHYRCSDFRKDYQTTIFVFDVSNPTNPQPVVKGPRLVDLWNHFQPATDFESKFVSASVGVYLYVDEKTGKIFDFYPTNFDVYHYFGTTSNVKFPSDAFYRLQNGLVIFSIDTSSLNSFREHSRHLLCEKKLNYGKGAKGSPNFNCSYSTVKIGIIEYPGGYGPLMNSEQSILNGVLFLKTPYQSEVKIKRFRWDGDSKTWKTYIESSGYVAQKGAIAVLTNDNRLVVVSDSNEAMTKYLSTLKNYNEAQTTNFPALDVSDAVIVQLNDKEFAIYQSHSVSLDVVKLTLTQPRPLPSSSPSFTPQTTTTILTTASATPSTGALSSIQGTLYSIRSILNNLRRILNR